MLFLGFLVALEKQLNRGSVGEFRRLSEAAIANVKKFGDRLNLRVTDAEIELTSCAVERFRLADAVRQGIGGALAIGPLGAIRIGHGQQYAPETGPPALIIRREIRATVKGLAIRKQETGQRPSALSGKGANRGLVAGVDIGALVAVDFHGHKVLVNNFGYFDALVAFSVEQMAQKEQHRAKTKQHRLVLGLS